MDPATATIASGIIGGVSSLFGAHSANQTNIKLSREQMAFQERMRATQYQTTVKDLIAAGLSPMIAYGHPAGTPPGSLAHVQDEVTPAVNTALAASTKAIELKAIQAGIAKTEAEARAADASALSSAGSARLTNANADIIEQYGMGEKQSGIALTNQQRLTSAAQAENLAANTKKSIAEMNEIAARIDNIKNDTTLKWNESIKTIEEIQLRRLDRAQQEQAMPFVIQHLKAVADLAQLDIPEAQNKAAAAAATWVSKMAEMGFEKDDIIRIIQAAGIGYLMKPGTTIINRNIRLPRD